MKSKEEIVTEKLNELSSLSDESLLVLWVALSEKLAKECPSKLAAVFTTTMEESILDESKEITEFPIVTSQVFSNVQKAVTIKSMVDDYTEDALRYGRMILSYGDNDDEEYEN